MHITKSYYFLWLHEEKRGQFSTFTGTPLVIPASLHSSLQTVLWLQGSSPQFSSKTLNSVWRSLHGEDSQPSPDASTHNQVIFKNNEGNKNHRQMTLLQQVYYGTVMLWPQVRNQNVTALSVTAPQTSCSSKWIGLNLTERARSKGSPRLRLGWHEVIWYCTKLFILQASCSSPPVRILVEGDTVRKRWKRMES